MSAICIIPAKGTSKRIPGKNIKVFFGKPIIAYSIATAVESCLFDEVVVSSESEEVLEVARNWGAVPLYRNARYAETEGHPDCGTQEVVRQALIGRLLANKQRYDYACCLYPCAPLVTTEDLGVGFWFVHRGIEPFSMGVFCGEDAGQFYWGHTSAFLSRISLYKAADTVEMGGRAIDVNTPEEWAALEKKWKELHP